ncbi:hypothetical protein CP960_12225 [Malaciobacter halophilus]|uniref:histidine kinase n=1 Tax=Malaciobacter halophilus TaxID=197482 RepID=A0A2N1J028_9BACT|nr:cache domain-containing protein [Malaciobacter halophilus]AXH10464.1 Cache sensor-containing signal transduction histidine kinase [Malaciobacter halophilus]PKI79896.1 hypothetical protein CP960_12225 [Malaciobacter halophilus]
MFQEKNLSKLIIFTPIVLIILVTTLVTYTQISHLETRFNKDSAKLKQKLIQEEKNKLAQKINGLDDYINYKQSTTKELLNRQIKKRVEIIYDVALNKYNTNTGIVSNEKIKKDLIEDLSQITFEHGTYYFVKEYKNNKIIPLLYPAKKEFVGKDISNVKDKEHQSFLQTCKKILKKSNEGFVEYLLHKQDLKIKDFNKISYIKRFEPFNWLIGYGKYKIDIENQIKSEVLNRVNLLKDNSNQTIFIYDKDFKNITNNYFSGYFVEELRKKVNENFKYKKYDKIYFFWTKNYEKLISYKFVKKWDWVIFSSIDLKNLENSIIEVLGTKKHEEDKFINYSIKIAFVVILFGSLLTLFLSKKIEMLFKEYKTNIESQKSALKNINATLESKVNDKTKQLEKLNLQLKEKVDIEVHKNRKKDQMLFNQSKMASMGEMIGNIAHQWRQPLSTISTAASGMSIKIDYNLATQEELKKDLKSIVDTTLYLSETIEDFRSFFKATKIKKRFCLEELIKKDLNIMHSSLKNHHIKVFKELEKIELYTIENELTQAILNILTNAKDALLEKVDNTKAKRYIFVKSYKKDEYVYIQIKDNAGGINKKIIDKVFEPYFTTKHQSQGTGIGLYMTREIIVKHLHGEIFAKNVEFKHQDEIYLGACFEIKLPVNKLT